MVKKSPHQLAAEQRVPHTNKHPWAANREATLGDNLCATGDIEDSTLANGMKIVMDDEHEKRIDELREFVVDKLLPLKTWKEVEKEMYLFRKRAKFCPRKNVLYHIYKEQEVCNPELEKLLMTKHMRSLSGVLVVTVLTAPIPTYTDEETGKVKTQRFSCKHNCYYCPNEPAHAGNNFVPQPRSYLHDEPGVLRANMCGFDAVIQFRERVRTYVANGHPIDKIEVLVLGGTWSEYPRAYQKEFVRDLFFASNTIFQNRTERLSLEEEIAINQDTKARIIGLTLETRPDTIDMEEVARLRSYGCTRLQIGIQHTDDGILEKINRGHTNAQTAAALKILKDNCFKVDIHLMPNLPGASVELDEAMFDEVLSGPDIQADQWKIYPCSVVPWTVIEKWHAEGKYKPYSDEDLFELIKRVKTKVHPWIRLNRVIRDIPNTYISGGCAVTNMRQYLQKRLADEGKRCRCVRCREVGGDVMKDPVLVVRSYAAQDGLEYFLSFESGDGKETLYGFLRLRIPSGSSDILPVLQGCALVRELHVYGQLRKVGDDGVTQHQGFGSQLLDKAEEIALQHGYVKMAVIAGVGARRYYEKFDYSLQETFHIKQLGLWSRASRRKLRRRAALALVGVAAAAAAVLVAKARGRKN